MAQKILFKYTTRSRRYNFLRGIDSIISNLSNKEDYHVLISVENEHHDPKMHPLPVLNCNHTYKVNRIWPTTKVDAINRDLNEFLETYNADIIVNMSDDMEFIYKGFDDVLRRYFAVSTDRSLLFFDGNRSDLITMSILGREYYNRDKYIYCGYYKSVFCDNEATEVARLRGCLVECKEHLFNHLHPAYGKGTMDSQYVDTESFYSEDFKIYSARKGVNFGLGFDVA